MMQPQNEMQPQGGGMAGLLDGISETKDEYASNFSEAQGEELQTADAILEIARQLLFENPETSEPIAERLATSKELPVDIGRTAAELVYQGVQAHKAVNYDVPSEILLSVGAEVVNWLYEVASMTDVYDSDGGKLDQHSQEVGLKYAILKFAELEPDLIDPKEAEALAQDVANGKYDNLMDKPTGVLTGDELPNRSVPIEQPAMAQQGEVPQDGYQAG